MKEYRKQLFEGERSLFKLENAQIDGCTFKNGESPLKEGKNLTVTNCSFEWKYPFWYGKGHKVSDSTLTKDARAAIWYTEDTSFSDLRIDAPKSFRRCHNITLERIIFNDASETLWNNDGVRLSHLSVKGDYFGLNSQNITGDNLEIKGNYAFDGCTNVTIKNSKLTTKDAFWNCKHVYIENSEISGEYFGWNSEDVTLVNCLVSSHQGFCYIKNLKMIDCQLPGTDLAFEYCENVEAKILGDIISVKNPFSGRIEAGSIKEIILDDPGINPQKTTIIERE